MQTPSFSTLSLVLKLTCLALVGAVGCSSRSARLAPPLRTNPPSVPERGVHGAVDAGARRQLFDDIAKELRERHVYPDVAERMIRALRDNAARGAYDSMTDGRALALAVSADLQAASQEPHVALHFHPQRRPPQPGSPGDMARLGFGKIERLSGNVGYLDILGFPPAASEAARDALASFMTRVADADALIIDLRNNNGGRTHTVALVASYLFGSTPVHLSTVLRRYDGSSYELWTDPNVPGTRFGDEKPLYLLTSARTFSGGEALAYELQARGRAKVIGETTRGGNSLPEGRPLAGGFLLSVPVARSISAATQTSRKGGVIPDIATPADSAMAEAHRRALEHLARNSRESP
jgi:hypothetical protein